MADPNPAGGPPSVPPSVPPRRYDFAPVRDPRPASDEWLAPFDLGDGVPRQLVEAAREQARATGYATGWAQGMREAYAHMAEEAEAIRQRAEALEQQRAAEVTRGLQALDRAAAELERRTVPTFEQLEETVVQMAVAIAEAVLGHELRRRNDRLVIEAMARILALVPGNEPVELRLSPADYAVLAVQDAVDRLGSRRTITVVTAADLEPGDVVARCAATEVDARVAPALARVHELLAAEPAPDDQRGSDGTALVAAAVDRRAS